MRGHPHPYTEQTRPSLLKIRESIVTTAMPPVRARPLGGRRITRKQRQNLRVGLLFVSPWIVGFLVFLVYPIIYTLRISFTQYTGFGEPKWIGLDNYRNLLNDDLFWT